MVRPLGMRELEAVGSSGRPFGPLPPPLAAADSRLAIPAHKRRLPKPNRLRPVDAALPAPPSVGVPPARVSAAVADVKAVERDRRTAN